jgi:MFS family permease
MGVSTRSMDVRPSAGAKSALGGRYAWFVWGLAVAFVVYLFGFQTGYSVVNPNIQKEVGLSVAQVGTIATVYTWAFAICQLFSGALLDRLGSRAIIPPAIGLVTLGIFLFANASTYEAFIAAQIVLALGACAGFVGAGYVGGQWFGMAKFSFMFGLVQFAASLFSAFGQNLIGMALDHLYWRDLFTAIAASGILLTILGTMFIRNPEPVQGPGLSAGIGEFLKDVFGAIAEVARMPHVWIAAIWGGMVFGAMLSCGVLWAPKLLAARGMPEQLATFSASIMWLGLAAGCLIVPKWSDIVEKRKLPTIVGILVQLAALACLVYLPPIGAGLTLTLCFVFGVGAAAHMLAFSTAGDVVPPRLIGTSAAIVNGVMFLVSGLLISMPGEIVTKQVNTGQQVSMSIVEQAANPLVAGLVIALVLALMMRETYPRR